jgi:ribosomal protein S3
MKFLENLTIYEFLFDFLNFFNKNPFFLNYKIIISGRFSRSSRSKIKIFKKGTIPLNTFKIPIDFGFSNCVTRFGVCGVKIFIHKSIYNASKNSSRVLFNRLKYLNIENKSLNLVV